MMGVEFSGMHILLDRTQIFTSPRLRGEVGFLA
jgi:hypothetical protein